jgi:hypothetical protein
MHRTDGKRKRQADETAPVQHGRTRIRLFNKLHRLKQDKRSKALSQANKCMLAAATAYNLKKLLKNARQKL